MTSVQNGSQSIFLVEMANWVSFYKMVRENIIIRLLSLLKSIDSSVTEELSSSPFSYELGIFIEGVLVEL